MNKLLFILITFIIIISCVSSYVSAQSLNSGVFGPQNASIVARIDCRSFGQTAIEGGTLNILYATPVLCWGTRSTVNGTPVNDTGWVPEVAFNWTWGDDNGLGTVTRGGVAMDLGVGVGLISATAFKPTTWGETCNGHSNNSLQNINLNVTAMENGVRVTDSATVTLCIENPETTWPAPIAYCDDSNCADDAGVPPGAVHGGNGTDLATILNNCDSTSNRLVVEGGVTFTTASTGITVGAQPCLVESYGGSQATFKFTSTSQSSGAISATGTAGYRLHNLNFAGSGTAPRMIVASRDNGYVIFLEGQNSLTAGEGFNSIGQIDTSSPGGATDLFWVRFNYQKHDGGVTRAYMRVHHSAFVGGGIFGPASNSSTEHIIRFPQWDHVVVDAMKFSDQHAGDSIITFRQNCGSVSSCTLDPFAAVAAVTRNEFSANAAGAFPVQFCTSGTGGVGGGEPTQCYDIDIIANLARWDSTTPTGAAYFYHLQGGGAAGTAIKRVRFALNVLDASQMDDGAGNRLTSIGPVTDLAFFGNLVVNTVSNGVGDVYSIANNANGIVDTAKNNACFENQANTSCDLFPSYAESADNKEVESATSPFSGGTPGTSTAFDWTDLIPDTGQPFYNAGTLDAFPFDAVGAVRPQGITEPGVREVN